VAEGEPLPFPEAPPARGHAIEVRLYAEDPGYAWRPSTGTLHQFAVAGTGAFGPPSVDGGVRVDSGVEPGSVVTVHYDPMLAKVISWAPTRREAARLLAATLAAARLHGVITNRDLLVRVLRADEFLAGTIDTAFLDRHPEVFAPLLSSVDGLRLACLASALAAAAARRARAAGPAIPSGWRNVVSAPQQVTFETPAGPMDLRYRFGRDGELAHWSAQVPGADQPPEEEGEHPPVALVSLTPHEVVLSTAGLRHTFWVHRIADVSYVDSSLGSVTLTELPRLPVPTDERPEGSLLALMPGAVGRIAVVVGQHVEAGELLLTLEAMKLEHPVHAPAAGVVAAVNVTPGSQVEAGAVLAVVTPT
jgi:propionyl-CoA carboxylase alpha chain